MTAVDYDPAIHLRMLPLYATPKVDGIRCVMFQGTGFARSNKPIPNHFVQHLVNLLPDGTDCELMIGPYDHPDHFQRTQVVTSDYDRINDLHVFIFDYLDPHTPVIAPYFQRIAYIKRWAQAFKQDWLAETAAPDNGRCSPPIKGPLISTGMCLSQNLHVLTPTVLRKPEHVDRYLQQCLTAGFEGIVLRRPDGGYKFGRSTAKEGLLIRLKPLSDSEARIVGFTELRHNDNQAVIGPDGKTHRSSATAGKRGGGTLGAFIVRDIRTSVEFPIGGGQGLDQALRKEVWNNRENYLGATIRYQYLATGTKAGGKPRMPKFIGFRSTIDMQNDS